jgi:acetyl-CoA carboxylase carboxyl transferase subunit beta
MDWLKRSKPRAKASSSRELPDGLWVKCDGCGEILYFKELERNLQVCPKCGHHFRLDAGRYVAILTDPGSFEETESGIVSGDPLRFKDSKKYTDRLKAAQAQTGMGEALLTGTGTLDGVPVVLGVMDFRFIGGSMASAVGEKIARAIQLALTERRPLILVTASGGARMMEGILSLMQMAKTSAWLARLRDERIPYICVLTHPTTGGVTASFAQLGDVILAEPGALIGFAGPRVIRETVAQELPEGFQRSEFLLEHGFVDRIAPRNELKKTISEILRILADGLQKVEGEALKPRRLSVMDDTSGDTNESGREPGSNSIEPDS